MSLFDDAKLIITPNGYKAGKLYSLKPFDGSGDCTVVRNTTATRVNSAGLIESSAVNVPRLDYSGGVTCPAVLVEPQRTNLFLNSRFDGAVSGTPGTNPTSWNVFRNEGTITVNSENIGNSITFDVNDERRVYQQSFSFTTAQVYYVSFLVNVITVGTITYNELLVNTGISSVFVRTYFKNGVEVTESDLVDEGEFYLTMKLEIINDFSGNIRVGVGTFSNRVGVATIYAPQFELGATPTSYIPTVATTVTRNADVISKTGVSALIGQTEGTVFIDFKELNYGPLANTTYFSISDGTINNQMRLFRGITINTFRILFQLNGGVLQYDINNLPFLVGQPNKIAFTYKSGDIAVVINGLIVNTSTNVLTISDTLSFYGFTTATGTAVMDVPSLVNQVILTDTRMPNAELIELTTL